MKKLILLISFMIIGGSLFGINKKLEMKKLILKIRDKSPQNFIIIPQNGSDIYFKDGEGVDYELIDAIDGVTQESLVYGYPNYGDRTSSREEETLLKSLNILKKLGKTVLTVNYTDEMWKRWRSRRLAEKYNFLNYTPMDREATKILKKVYFENSEDIVDLSYAKNFLYLLNPEQFKHKVEYIDRLSKTKYDILIIDMYFEDIKLTVEDIQKLKQKPQGGERLIIGYFSIGEAEDYREYWKNSWNKKLPSWILYENEEWEGNYIVKYWLKEWQAIIEVELNKYLETGFDGVFLDTIDTYESLGEGD